MAERILHCGSNLALEQKGYLPLEVVDDDTYTLFHQDNGVCHFYQDDLCELHRSHGLSHKPVVCRLYPYTLVGTPGGTFVSLLYSCPAVMAGTGAGPSEQREDLTALFQQHGSKIPHIAALQSPIPVTGQKTISWPEYLKLEEELGELLDGADPVGSLFKMVQVLLPTVETAALRSQVVEVAKMVKAALPSHEDLRGEFSVLTPTNTMERASIQRFLLHHLHGKLFLVGSTLVSQTLAYAVGLGLFLQILEEKKRREEVLHFSFDLLHQCFEWLEETFLPRLDKLDRHFLAWEEQIVLS